MLLNAAVMLILGQADGDKLPTAADAMAAAHADLAKLPAAARYDYRYLSLHNLTAKERADFAPVLAGHCNQLSRTSIIERPRSIAGGLLLRVNLRDYRWDAATWERLTDPYFSVVLVKEQEYGYYDHRGAWVRTRIAREKQPALAPWLAEAPCTKEQVAEVAAWTGSRAPVVRADWFMNQTAAQAERDGSGYYDFLGVKDEATFQAIGGFDRKTAEAFRFELREAVSVSGVSLQPRAITRHDSLGGGYWRSLDFKLAKDDKNPLRVLGRDVEKAYDASEQFIHLPNGFWATGLFDRAGKRQDFAPPDIASDSASKSNDRRVHVNVSCLRCHADGGLQDIDGWARNILAGPPLDLRSYDYEKAVELKQQYARRLEPFLARDRLVFETAVLEATGLTAKVYSSRYAAAWERYEDAKVTAEMAARDVGLDVETFRTRLLTYAKVTGNLDPVLSVFALKGPRERAIGIRQFEESYPILQSVIRGFRP